MKFSHRTFAVCLATSVCAPALLGSHVSYAQADATVSFDITAADLGGALNQFAHQSKRQIVYASGVAVNRASKPLHGTYRLEDALQMLLQGSGLEYKIGSDNTIVVLKAAAKAEAPPNLIRLAAVATQVSASAPTEADAVAVEEVIVTGSRIVREGYEAPTPLTVVGVEMLEKSADTNLVSLLSTMPAITGAAPASTSAGSLGAGNGGLQTLNLRSLGAVRTLVLIDGQRSVASHYSGIVSIDNFPSQLVSRIDVVTGGTSAVYGSDAVTGVVNFVLDKEFTGVKAEVSGGLTNHSDSRNYKVDLSGGFGFAGGRGHVLISGQHLYSGGVDGIGGRDEYAQGWVQFNNPNYTTTNGQPQLLFMQNSSVATATRGGIIFTGPLKGTAFGPGGTPYQFQYGSVFSNPYMSGGDWASNNVSTGFDLEPSQTNDNFFTRVAYDVTDNFNVFVQYNFSQNNNRQDLFYPFFLGNAVYLVRTDNAYIPAATRAAMTAAGITSFSIGTFFGDYGQVESVNSRLTNRVSAGVEGAFSAFDTTWTWQATYGYGSTRLSQTSETIVTSRFLQSLDSVYNANGQIVCRSTLTNPADGCKPWNFMGIDVNDPNGGGREWLNGGGGYQRGLIELETYSASVTGEPFSLWAGPVSLALSAEYRTDEIHSNVDAFSLAANRSGGAYAPLNGKSSVTEGAIETVVPLAKGESWAEALDVNAGVRFTDYEISGYVTTWKIGSTYAPNDQIKFRATQSRDIRAPNLLELFGSPSFSLVQSSLTDPFRNNQPTPGNTQSITKGNPALVPERADSTNIGVILTPAFLEGFTVSVDYWRVNLKGAIQSISPQNVINSCFTGLLTSLCGNIARNADGTISTVTTGPVNLAAQEVKGLDLEASYRMPLSQIMSDWDGTIALHGLMSIYLRDYQSSPFSTPVDLVGQYGSITPGGANPPDWKLNVTATYSNDPITVSLTGRALSSGQINNLYIECTTGCPTSTVVNPTINSNSVPGTFYLDANVNYNLSVGETTTADLFISAKNLFNKTVPPLPGTPFFSPAAFGSPFDALGTVYRAGIRLRM